MFLSSRQAGYSNRLQRQPRPEYKSDKCEVSGRYFVVGGQMAGCRHILTGLLIARTLSGIHLYFISLLLSRGLIVNLQVHFISSFYGEKP